MEVLVYEFFSAGGCYRGHEPAVPVSLLDEGAAMVAAVTADLARIDNVHPVILQDQRLKRESVGNVPDPCQVVSVDSEQAQQREFERLVVQTDAVLLIAPEWDDILLDRAKHCLAWGATLLSPGPDLIGLAADKVALADYLGQHNLPVPAGCLLAAQQLLPGSFPYPGILKPRYGAGSAGLSWIEDAHCEVIWDDHFSEYRLEQYCPGIAVSVAVLRGPAGVSVLPACQQLLSRDDRFQYLGGTVPIVETLARRAERLALRVVDVLPPSVGYLGIDLVLGETEAADRIIEINPRLTTSYVGLSQLTKGNLAEAMLGVALGDTCTLRFRSEPIWFDATGAGVAVEDHYDSPVTRQGVRA